MAHFERKLRTLAQLCQDPEGGMRRNGTRHNLPQTAVIPLASFIEPQPKKPSRIKRRSLSNSITRDMYAEAIECIMDLVKYLGRDSVELDVEEEEGLFLGKQTN